MSSLAYKIDILIIGGGQAGLSAAYHLGRLGWRAARAIWFWTNPRSPAAPGNSAGRR